MTDGSKIYPPPGLYGLEQLGWTQGRVAHWLGISRGSVSNWGAARRRCAPKHGLMLETILNVSIVVAELEIDAGALDKIEASGDAPAYFRELVNARMDAAKTSLKVQRIVNNLICSNADRDAAFAKQKRLSAEIASEPQPSPVRLVAGAYYEERPAMQAKGPE